MDGAPRCGGVFRFESYTLNLRAGELRENGHRIKIQDQPLQVLSALLERPGEVVTQEELRGRIWPDDVVVDFEHSLRTAVLKLREALGDSASNPHYIETVPRRGYRFVAAVDSGQMLEPFPVEAPASLQAHWTGTRISALQWRIIAVVAAILLAAGAALWWRLGRVVPPGRQQLSTEARGSGSRAKFTRIRIPVGFSGLAAGALSPEGNKFAFAAAGSVWVVPIHGKVDPSIAGGPLRLTEAMKGRVMDIGWSADGARISFELRSASRSGVLVVPATGGKVRKVPLQGSPDILGISLSPDGKTLALASTEQTVRGWRRPPRIYTVPVEGGIPRSLTDGPTIEPSFSPDGKKIACVRIISDKPYRGRFQLGLIPAGGGKPVPVADAGEPYQQPIWSPDGKAIAFLTYPRKKNEYEARVVRFADDGTALRDVTRIPLPHQPRKVAGWSADGKIGLVLQGPRYVAIYTVPVSGGIPTQVTPPGLAADPNWTPDGKEIFFRWGRGQLASVPSGGGEVSIVLKRSNEEVVEAVPGGGTAVSPDGTRVVFSGYRAGMEGVHIWTNPIEGGEPKQLTRGPTESRFPCWSPDGKWVAFLRAERGGQQGTVVLNIYIVAADGGPIRQITTTPDDVAWSTIAWSPDGKLLAYFSRDKKLKVIPAEGGWPREVAELAQVNGHSGLAWSPDSKKLAYTERGRIHIASLNGGEVASIVTGLEGGTGYISWSPDGNRFALACDKGGSPELWLMEDFLPSDKPAD